MKKVLLSVAFLAFAFTASSQSLPENPEPGKCYVRCKTPEVWKNESTTVQVAPAYKTLRVVPAAFKTVSEQVIGTAAGKSLHVTPAVFKTESFSVPTEEASYSLVVIPETYEKVTEVIVVSEASERLEIVPAVYENKTFTIVTKPAYEKLSIVPAVYETKTSSVVCQIASKRLEVVSGKWGTENIAYRKTEFGTSITVSPATFGNNSETIEIKPASAQWQMSERAPDCTSSDPNDCRYWCFKETPAQYTTVTKTTLVKDATISRNNECDDPDCGQATYTKKVQSTPPTIREIAIPQIVKNYTTRVMVTPPSTRKVTVPAVSKTFTKKVMVTPPTTRKIVIPAVTKTITKTVVRPATTRRVEIAGKTKTMQKTVLVSAATSNSTVIPSVMKTINKTILVKDSYTTENAVAAKYSNVNKEILVSKGGLTSWKEVECSLVNYSPLPINWNLGSATLTSAAKQIIDARLLPILKQGITAEIASHTDSRGSSTSNQNLSERRAKAVVNYLMSKGINASQLVANGFGENKLTNRCADGVSCTEAEHARNRRTEFRAINQ